MGWRLSLVICGGAFLNVGSVLAADDFSLQQKINACHVIADRDARMSCYDKLAAPESISASPGRAPAPVPPALQAAAGAPATSPSNVQPPPSTTGSLAQPDNAQTSESLRSDTDEILIAISNVSISEGHALRFTTSDGIPWVQTDEKLIHKMPTSGDLVKISRSYLGYTCKLNKADKFRCKPPNGLNGKLNLN